MVLQCSPVQARYPSAKNHFRYGAQRSFGAGPSATRKAVKQCGAHFYLRKCKAAASLFLFIFGGAWMIGWWPIWEGCNSELMWQVQWQNWCQLKLRFHQLRKCQQFAFSSKKKRRRNIYQMLYWAHDPYFVTLSGFAHCNFTFLEEPFVPRYL